MRSEVPAMDSKDPWERAPVRRQQRSQQVDKRRKKHLLFQAGEHTARIAPPTSQKILASNLASRELGEQLLGCFARTAQATVRQLCPSQCFQR